MLDATLAYWRASFAGSALLKLVYRVRGGNLQFAPDLTRRPPVSALELKSWARHIEWRPGQTAADPPEELIQRMGDLVESGQMAAIDGLVGLAWPARVPGREQFVRDFRAQLAKSPYWGDWQALSRTGAPARREQKRPPLRAASSH